MNWIAPANTALIIVDVQNDFCPGGALAVADGDKIVPIINAMAQHFRTRVLTQDFHPANHASFASNHPGKSPFETVELPYGTQVLWPDHCVQDTDGAAFHPDLNDGTILEFPAAILQKGENPGVDSYSGFFENDGTSRPTFDNGETLSKFLHDRGVTKVVLCGLAYDFCIGWHALDAVKEGFKAVVVKDATRSIAMPVGDSDTEKLMDEKLQEAGVQIIYAAGLPQALGVKSPAPALAL